MHHRLLSLCLCLSILSASAALPPLVDVFVAGQEGYSCYRIPAMIQLPDGTYMVFAEGRKFSCADHGWNDLVYKSSSDGGNVWSSLRVAHGESSSKGNVTIGNPAPVVMNASTILLPFSRNNLEAGLLLSTDGGASFQLQKTLLPVPTSWPWVATGPPGGLLLPSGRILIPSDSEEGGPYSFSFISDDGGASWSISNSIANGNEAQAALLPWLGPDSVLMSMRSPHSTRLAALSTDGGSTWGTPWETIKETSCEGSIVALPDYHQTLAEGVGALAPAPGAEPRLVQSSAFSAQTRQNMTLHTSTDGGHTWTPVLLIYPGSAAYSSLVAPVGAPNSVALAFERDNYGKISVAMNLEVPA